MQAKRRTTKPGASFERLLEVCGRLGFEPHDIARRLDGRGRYAEALDREFPFLIRLFHYSSQCHTRGATWHERLELFLPLDGPARFRMAEEEVSLEPGDLLVVENFKLHHVVDFPGFDTRAIVISFMPEFVYSLGSPSHDYAFLQPFYSRPKSGPRVLRRADASAGPVHLTIAELLERYFARDALQLRQAGCKALFLMALYHLARHWSISEVMQWEFAREQQRTQQLKPLFEHISQHYAEKVTVAQAARLVHMSQPHLMKVFKRVSGMTLVGYLNHVRLANATRLLREADRSIAEVANEVGFADQSYFDKQFKRAFGCTPREFRSGREQGPARRSPDAAGSRARGARARGAGSNLS